MSAWSGSAPADSRLKKPARASRFGRALRFCLDQMSGMRISFGSGGHEQKLTLTFSFLSSLVALVIFLTVLWALAAGWLAVGDQYGRSWGQTAALGDGWYAVTIRVIAAGLVTIGTWLVGAGEAIGTALLVFLASASIGAIVGFLFGVPRPLSESGPGAASAAAAATSSGQMASPAGADGTPAGAASSGAPGRAAPVAAPGWYANTNLTQVSDWLTKIIVGVGLVEASRIGGVARDINARVEPLLFEGRFGTALVMPALMIVGLIIGFMYCYLFTQLFLAALMAHAAEEVSHSIDLLAAEPAASSELSSIPPGAFVVAPPIQVPGSGAPVRSEPTPTIEQTTAAAQMQSVPLAEVDDPASLAIWAKAGAVLNQYDKAVAGYRKLLGKERKPEVLVEAARVFSSAKNFTGARRLIDEAFARRKTADTATQARIIFDMAHLALYDRAPDGYRRALVLLDDPGLIEWDRSGSGSGSLHVLRACAMGQRYAFETALDDDQRADIRARVLDDLRIALKGPDNRVWILYLLDRDPEGRPRRTQASGLRDDDLFPFKDDQDFLALVGAAS